MAISGRILPVEWISSLIDTQVYTAWWQISLGQVTVESAAEYIVLSLFEGVGTR